MRKVKRICLDCDKSYMGYGESSEYYGLRCSEYDECVETCRGKDCIHFINTAALISELQEQIEKMKNCKNCAQLHNTSYSSPCDKCDGKIYWQMKEI